MDDKTRNLLLLVGLSLLFAGVAAISDHVVLGWAFLPLGAVAILGEALRHQRRHGQRLSHAQARLGLAFVRRVGRGRLRRAGRWRCVVGRIFKVHAAPVGTPWMWTLAFGHHEDRTTRTAPRRTAMSRHARLRWQRSPRAGAGHRPFSPFGVPAPSSKNRGGVRYLGEGAIGHRVRC
jgi:hypothetical protein